ncbi:MAG TPA: 23S rRNA (adenine(2030)-N(6))-methyltransferase RlmJ [Opitutaceae bacterium]|nr:23S rRNA (adenine(2030)-N(6))-methyltransferase RlmJ [Opitutaceae bacterium]
MNYRHQFHAGNFADVVKHVVLGALLARMKQKERPFLYLDTHAGRGRYDLMVAGRGDSLPRQPEWPLGLGRIEKADPLPPLVAQYLEAVQVLDRAAGNLQPEIRYYPGSPRLARYWMRSQDRLALCELQPAECAALTEEMRLEKGVRVHPMDGYTALKAMLPPLEKRGLVLIDPPFESPAEWSDLVQAMSDGLRRFPSGVFAIWYPLTERARIERFVDSLLALSLPPTWRAEVAVAGEGGLLKMRGCGLVVINPPWQLDDELIPVLDFLARVLAQDSSAEGRLDWLVPEA